MDTEPTQDPQDAAGPDDDAIRALVSRLARPHRSGGKVVERAALLSQGADFNAVLSWIEAHGGQPEEARPAKKASRGLHSAREVSSADRQPQAFVLPAGALG